MTSAKKVSEMTSEEIKKEVQKAYARVAQPNVSSCCGPSTTSNRTNCAEQLGYSVDEMPIEAIESFAGCGNPVALASLREGETVLDLGSGAGLDALMAARKVGDSGHVIGVDMTPEMIHKAEIGAEKLGFTNVEYRLGDIEDLPVDDSSVDVVISNCVINLAPDKAKVFREAFRVLRPGGRMMISDIVLETSLPDDLRDEVATYTGCLGGAILADEYMQLMRDAGFKDVEIVQKAPFGFATSAKITAHKLNK